MKKLVFTLKVAVRLLIFVELLVAEVIVWWLSINAALANAAGIPCGQYRLKKKGGDIDG